MVEATTSKQYQCHSQKHSWHQALHRTEPQLTASENNSPLSWTLAFIPLKEFSRSFFATLLRRMELRMDSKEFSTPLECPRPHSRTLGSASARKIFDFCRKFCVFGRCARRGRTEKIPTTVPHRPLPPPPSPLLKAVLAQLSCNSENSSFFSHCGKRLAHRSLKWYKCDVSTSTSSI